MDNRRGHIDGSVSALNAHVTPGMHKRLMIGVTEQWETALDARLAVHSASPVCILNDLLRTRASVIRPSRHRSMSEPNSPDAADGPSETGEFHPLARG